MKQTKAKWLLPLFRLFQRSLTEPGNLRDAWQPVPRDSGADGLWGSLGTSMCSSESSCVLIIPRVPEAEVHLYRQWPLLQCPRQARDILFKVVWPHKAVSAFTLKMVPWRSYPGLASSLLAGWLDIPGEGDWAFSSLRLFLQLTNIKWLTGSLCVNTAYFARLSCVV